jgi:hypothetical protein
MSDHRDESFNIDDVVKKLKEEGIGYSTSSKNVVKVIDNFSGKGIEEDLSQSESYHEVPTNLTDKYPEIFALKLGKIHAKDIDELQDKDICFFAPGLSAIKTDIVIAFDGITYKIKRHDPEGLDTALAVLISLERKFR